MLDNPIFAILAYATSIIFTLIAAMVPPNAGNFVMGLFASSMASFLGGEDESDAYEMEIEDNDI
jgi:hypothetical protein